MKNNRKGFTTVELVIVIAVIAILAAVLIPTFSNLITKANDSAALQEASNVYKNYMIEHATEAHDQTVYIQVDDVYFTAVNGKLGEKATEGTANTGIVIKHDNGDLGFVCAGNHADNSDPADSICDICGADIAPATPDGDNNDNAGENAGN